MVPGPVIAWRNEAIVLLMHGLFDARCLVAHSSTRIEAAMNHYGVDETVALGAAWQRGRALSGG